MLSAGSLLSSSPPPTILSSVVHALETAYLAGFPLVQVYVSILAPFLARRYVQPATTGKVDLADTTPAESFLPLMVVSTYCAVGLVWAWLRLAWIGLTSGAEGWEDRPPTMGSVRRDGDAKAKVL